MDIYKTLEDLKEGQEKMLELLNNHLNGNSKEKIHDLVDLMQILHVSKRTIATWIKLGILPHTRVGGKIWVTSEHLRLFMEQNNSMVNKNQIKWKGGQQ